MLALPLALLVAAFVALDPFHLIYPVESPLTQGALMNDRYFQARWLMGKSDRYDAFIFGSSRSKAFHTAAWKRRIGDAEPFHLGVNDETLFGIERKLAFLDRQGFRIRHALLSLDARILSRTRNPDAHVFREHPVVSGEPAVEYYKRYVVAFLDPEFLLAYSEWRLTGEASPGSETLIWTEDFTYDPETGDHYYSSLERELSAGEEAYYAARPDLEQRPGPSTAEPVIDEDATRLLGSMAGLFARHETEVRVVITPNFDRAAIAPADSAALAGILGRRVWDFSGQNALTMDTHNYYEERHFRPEIGDWILSRLDYGEAASSRLPQSSRHAESTPKEAHAFGRGSRSAARSRGAMSAANSP